MRKIINLKSKIPAFAEPARWTGGASAGNYNPKANYIIGIDEVGRGALAGPVVVAALAAPTKLRIKNAELGIKIRSKNSKFFFCQRQIPGGSILNSKLAKLRDSKKLSPKQREIWFEWIKKHSNILENVGMFYAVASVSPKIIDKINISQAANLAASRAFNRLTKNSRLRRGFGGQVKLKAKNFQVFLDGGLYLNKNIRVNPRSHPRISASTIIKGDEKIPAISLASIVAKVSRDRMMVKLHGKYPKYCFDKHKGYGTKLHYKKIKKHGPSKIHRLTFFRKIR